MRDGEVAELENLNKRLFQRHCLGRIAQRLLDCVARHIVAEGDGRRDDGAGGLENTHWIGDEIEIGQGNQVAILGLDLGIKDTALGDTPEIVSYADEVTDAEARNHTQEDPRERVAEKSRGRQGDRRAQEDGEKLRSWFRS
ncbi:MAG: hypothetical protein OEM62_10585 [Acidobacteriota bacterium]|nr:hypothetical protein [Acidobacteriota bacterium]